MINPILNYCLTAAAILTTGALLYYLCFFRSTYLNWNRHLLWGLLLASLVVPLIQVPETWTIWHKIPVKQSEILASRAGVDKGVQPRLEQEFGEDTQVRVVSQAEKKAGSGSASEFQLNWFRLTLWLYGLGCLAFGLRFVLQIISLWKLYHQARIEQRDDYRLVIYPGELSPFAFGRCIFIAESLYGSTELDLVLTHELAHIRQRHTLDILAAELLLIWQWFNPGAWLYRRLVETNLEYLADRSVLHQQWDKKQYQLSLLNWSNATANNRLSTSYNFSLLKERIMMMNRRPSSKTYRLRYALIALLLPILPLFNLPNSSSDEPETRGNHLPLYNFFAPSPAFSGEIKSNAHRDLLDSKTSRLVHHIENKEIEVKPLDITPKEKTAISLVLVIIGKDITSTEMEALKKTELPFKLDLRFSLDQQGKLKAVTLHSEGAGDCGLAVDANNPLPLVLTGEIGGCGSQSFTLKLLEKVQKGQIEKSTQVLTGGIPLDPTGFEAYKTKIIDLQSNSHQRRLEKLAANNWTEEIEDAHDEMRIPLSEGGLETMIDRMKSCLRAGKELQVYINDGAPQSTIPLLNELQIKKFATHWKSKNYYFKGTTQIQKTEWLGLRVEIFTE
jgi:BlaR1 peptidase M56